MSAIVTSMVCTLILNIISIYIVINLLNKKVKLLNTKNVIIILFLTIIQTIAYNSEYSISYTITNYLLVVITNKLIFKENMYKTIVVTCTSLIILMIGDFINSIIMINFVSLNEIRSCWYLRIISNLFVSVYSFVITSIPVINKKCRYFLNKLEGKCVPITALFAILIISIVFITYNIAIDFAFDMSFITNILTIVTLIAFFYIFIIEDNEFNKLNDEYDSLFKCIQTFEEWIEREQLNRHEYKNQLASLRCISKEKKVKDKIDSIISDNININSNTVNQLKPLPNDGLKGLLYYKIVVAQNNKLNVEVDISIKKFKTIKSISEEKMKIVCRLVGIYMDNAIEASIESKIKIISVEIYELKNELNVVIANSFNKNKDISRRNEKGYSTKGKGRGNGLYFAKRMVDKYNWITETQNINQNFYIQKLVIKIKEAK